MILLFPDAPCFALLSLPPLLLSLSMIHFFLPYLLLHDCELLFPDFLTLFSSSRLPLLLAGLFHCKSLCEYVSRCCITFYALGERSFPPSPSPFVITLRFLCFTLSFRHKKNANTNRASGDEGWGRRAEEGTEKIEEGGGGGEKVSDGTKHPALDQQRRT